MKSEYTHEVLCWMVDHLLDRLKAVMDERDELLSALKMARQDIENTRNIFLNDSLDQKFYDNMAIYDNLISKYGEKDYDN